MSIEDFYNSIFYLYSTPITDRSSIGGIVRTVQLKQSNIPCYITYISGEEQVKYGKNNIVATYRLFCNPIEIDSTDVVRIIDEDGDNWYDVAYIDNCNDMDHHFELNLIGIKAPQEILESSSSSSSSSSLDSSSSSSTSSSEGYSSSSSSSSSEAYSSSSSSFVPDSSSSSSSSSLDDNLWTPDLLGSTLKLWLDADDADTITQSGGLVSQWNDKSGNNKHAVQNTGAQQPTYSLTGLNNKPAVVWPNQANPCNMVSGNLSTYGIRSAFFVIQFGTGVETHWYISYQGVFGGNNSPMSLIGSVFYTTENKWDTNAVMMFYNGRYNGGDSVNLKGYTTLPMTPTILEATADSLQTPFSGWYIGMDRTFIAQNRGWSGPISEVIFTDTVLSESDRQKIEGYLAWKWNLVGNLPVGHPYKNTPPKI